jgi:FkbM family methyltransferase
MLRWPLRGGATTLVPLVACTALALLLLLLMGALQPKTLLWPMHGNGASCAESLEATPPRSTSLKAHEKGYVSFLFSRLGFTQGNLAVPPLLRQPHGPAVVVDVGMFDGSDYTKPAAKGGHRVYAFEMGAPKIAVVAAWAAANNVSYQLLEPQPGQPLPHFPDRRPATERPQLYLIHAAASSATGQATSIRNVKDGAVDTLEVDPKYYPCSGDSCVKETVGVLRLDDVVDEDVWLLKIDTQGYDCHVLHGAERLLRTRRVQYVTYEFAPKVMDSTGCTALASLELLHRLNYQCFEWSRMANGFADDRDGQSFTDYLRDFDTSHTQWWVRQAWTELFCVHKSHL